MPDGMVVLAVFAYLLISGLQLMCYAVSVKHKGPVLRILGVLAGWALVTTCVLVIEAIVWFWIQTGVLSW